MNAVRQLLMSLLTSSLTATTSTTSLATPKESYSVPSHQDGSISIGLELSYYINMLKPYNLHNINSKPVTTTAKLPEPLDNSAHLDAEAHHQFRATVGQLIWASLERPDLMCAAKLHSSHVQHPTTSDAASLKHTLRYIRGTMDYRLVLGRHLQRQVRQWHGDPIPIHVNAYTDSDWAGDIKTRKSTSSYIVSVLGVPLSFASRTQHTICHSSAEAELMALGSGLNASHCILTAHLLHHWHPSRHISLKYSWLQDECRQHHLCTNIRQYRRSLHQVAAITHYAATSWSLGYINFLLERGKNSKKPRTSTSCWIPS